MGNKILIFTRRVWFPEEISSRNLSKMKSNMLVTLQVLLITLPFVSVDKCSSEISRSSDLSDDMSKREDRDGGDEIRVIPVKMPRFCWGSPPSCLDVETKVTLTRKEEEGGSRPEKDGKSSKKTRKNRKGRRPRVTACYKNIKIKMTEDCSPYQPIDFSNVRVYDYCMGERAQLGGSITMFYTISNPCSIRVNITKIAEHCYKQRRGRASKHGGAVGMSHILHLDGCKLFGPIFCTRRGYEWCTCPIPWGKAPLYRAYIDTVSDFLPHGIGTGKFVGRADFHFPKGESCVEFTFDREEMIRPK